MPTSTGSYTVGALAHSGMSCVYFVTGYIFIMEKAKEMNMEAGRAEARVQKLCEKGKKIADPKTQKLIEVVEEIDIKLGRKNENEDCGTFPRKR